LYNENRIKELFEEAQTEYERYSKWAETSYQKMTLLSDILSGIQEKKSRKRKQPVYAAASRIPQQAGSA
jgi:hypothetical protein